MILSKTALHVATAAIAGGFATASMSSVAFADWHRDHRWHHPHHERVVVAGPPAVYEPPPPPVVYAAPAYEPPPVVGFGLNIHVR